MSNPLRVTLLTALVFLWIGGTISGSRASYASPQGDALQELKLNLANNGKHVSAKLGQAIVVTLQTIGPGQYGSPTVSSPAVRFKSSSFAERPIPAGPTQIYRFLAASPGDATIEMKHSDQPRKFRITIQVQPK